MKRRTGGWAGRILRVNLGERSFQNVSTEPYAERFVGGIGLAAKIAWDEIPPHVDALGPENKLVFATGPLTGTLAPGSGRMEIMGKSPRTYPRETVTRSGMGGHWGVALKHAGYDGLVVEGEADGPVYLLVSRGDIRFLSAIDCWGLDTYQTQKLLKERHGSHTQILCIGPAGENKCRIATIISETSFASGKSGFGAVMGAKKLKAIVVDGSGGSIGVAHPGRLVNLAATYRDLLGVSPAREWTVGYSPPDHHKRFFAKYRRGNASCFGCPLQCWAFISVPGTEPSQAGCVNYYYMTPAYAYYGETLEADQALWLGNVLCNQLGLDTFEMAGVVPWLEDLFRAGAIGEQDSGLPLGKMGSKEFIVTLLHNIAHRTGIGDLLAEGAARAAEAIPGAWGLYEKYYPAHGQTEHNSVRSFPGIALLWALDSRDPMIDHHAYRHLSVTRQRWPEPHGMTRQQAEAIAERVFGTKAAIDHETYASKAQAVAYCQNRSCVINTLVLCDFLFPIFISQSRADRMGDTAAESKLFAAVTGLDLSETELDRVGERVWNLQRCIMVREGRSRDQDTLHEGYFREVPGGQGTTTGLTLAADDTRAVPRKVFERAKAEYYIVRGWDPATGRPTRETLLSLGLQDVAETIAPA
jgi:aldehyde:ferredoxin oxidoreductase